MEKASVRNHHHQFYCRHKLKLDNEAESLPAQWLNVPSVEGHALMHARCAPLRSQPTAAVLLWGCARSAQQPLQGCDTQRHLLASVVGMSETERPGSPRSDGVRRTATSADCREYAPASSARVRCARPGPALVSPSLLLRPPVFAGGTQRTSTPQR